MKTKNLILIVALLSIATMTFSQSKDDTQPFTVKITLKCALQDPYLVRAMHEQITNNFLPPNPENHLYSAVVRYKGTRYIIVGRYNEWVKFFEMELINPIPDR
jgi:hypothetical protein